MENKEITNNNCWIYQLQINSLDFGIHLYLHNYSNLEDIYYYVIAPNIDRYASITYEKVCQQYLYNKKMNFLLDIKKLNISLKKNNF